MKFSPQPGSSHDLYLDGPTLAEILDGLFGKDWKIEGYQNREDELRRSEEVILCLDDGSYTYKIDRDHSGLGKIQFPASEWELEREKIQKFFEEHFPGEGTD